MFKQVSKVYYLSISMQPKLMYRYVFLSEKRRTSKLPASMISLVVPVWRGNDGSFFSDSPSFWAMASVYANCIGYRSSADRYRPRSPVVL